jgi:replicative DNA helicase
MNNEEIKNLEETNRIIEESLNNREDKIIHIAEFEEAKLSKPFSTGFEKLDECILGGVRGGDLVLMGGLSKHGKTQVSLQMTKSFSDQAIPVLWFSFEMPVPALKWRFKNMYKNDFNEKDLLCYMPKKNVSDKVEWLEGRILDANKRFQTQIVIIDNLDFLTIEQKYGDDKLVTQKRIVGMLKRIALELDVVVILNVHVSKLPQGQKRPKMSNVYGASETYKLADLILFVYRKQEQLEQESRNSQPVDVFSSESELIVDGNRLTGINRTINLDFKDNNFKELNY